jgi:Uroporphyrinogen-III decarboxylase
MKSKEIITRCIEFNNPGRIGLDFNSPHHSDIFWIKASELKYGADPDNEKLMDWGYHNELMIKVPHFSGELMIDEWGTIFGRLEQVTKGEPIKGALEDGWEMLADYIFPVIDTSYIGRIKAQVYNNSDKFILGAMPCSPFATMRDIRRMDNLFIDLLTEEEKVLELNEKIEQIMYDIIDICSVNGFDGIVIYEDWGIQNSLLISPKLWRNIFKPIYKRLIEYSHKKGLKFFVHSCGYVYDIIEDFIEVGVDVFQFDQPELVGVEKLSKEFGGRVTFWCPVDIQRIMVTGDRQYIEKEARKMADWFGKFSGGFIAKDYPQWDAIGVKEEWAQWARDVFISVRNY